MFGTDGDGVFETQRSKLEFFAVMIVVINLVDQEKNGMPATPQLRGQLFINGIDALHSIHCEQNEIGCFHSDVDLSRDLFGESVIKRGTDSACIYDRERAIELLAGAVMRSRVTPG